MLSKMLDVWNSTLSFKNRVKVCRHRGRISKFLSNVPRGAVANYRITYPWCNVCILVRH